MIPLLYILHLAGPKDHYGDSIPLAILVIFGIPGIFITTVIGLLRWRTQTTISRWLLGLSVILLLFFTLPIEPFRALRGHYLLLYY